MLSRDVLKGSDIDITFEMSESRDLTVRARVKMTDQEFQDVFSKEERETVVADLQEQVSNLSSRIEEEMEDAKNREDYETAKQLRSMQREVEEVESRSTEITEDDVTDDRYQLEDRKRELAQELDNATKDKYLQEARKEYEEVKESCDEVIDAHGNDDERRLFEKIVAQESTFLSSSDPSKIHQQKEELQKITYSILWRTPAFLRDTFNSLVSDVSRMNNQEQAKSLVESGRHAIDNQNWDRLTEVNRGLIDLLPKDAESGQGRIGF
jgi:molecular chaperone DnaK